MKAILLAAALSVAACGDTWLGEAEDPPLPGKREPVLALDESLRPDSELSGAEIRLPPPIANDDWPQAGGRASHAMHHLAAGSKLSVRWTARAGRGSSDDGQLLAQPVVGEGLVFTIDVAADIRAHDLGTGAAVWRNDVAPPDGEGILGGGLAYAAGRLYATTGFAEVFALDAASGAERWRQRLTGPIRAAPTVSGGRLFVVTLDNRLHALDAEDGSLLWSHSGIVESLSLVGGAAPAVADDIVVAAFSSGEIVALRVANGRVVWSDALVPLSRSDPVSSLPHVRGRLVIDRDLVLAAGNGGPTVAIELRSGLRVWEQEVGGVYGPWVAGAVVYLVSSRGELLCLSRSDGRVRWLRALPRYEDEEDRTGAIQWSGPVLVGGRLLLGSDRGELRFVSPDSGETVDRRALSDGLRITAAAARGTVLLLTEAAELIALQ